MRTYYWKEKKNFGDLLTPLLLNKFLHKSSEWSSPKEAELVMVGSVLEHLPKDFNGIIAGAGQLHERTIVNFPKATILGLRGPLTAKGLKGDFILGDPGLLADELVKMPDKEYELGIVPHWSDEVVEHNPIFLKYDPLIIRVSDDPLKVIEQIGKCRKIVASSLHGIIIADAFNIPRRTEIPPRVLSHPQDEGGIFKWKDYNASIGMKFEIGLTQQADYYTIMEKRYELHYMFEKIDKIFS